MTDSIELALREPTRHAKYLPYLYILLLNALAVYYFAECSTKTVLKLIQETSKSTPYTSAFSKIVINSVAKLCMINRCSAS